MDYVVYQDKLYRILCHKSSHYGDDMTYWIQHRNYESSDLWWDLFPTMTDLNEPYSSLDKAINHIKSLV
jgi:hypothetical protein